MNAKYDSYHNLPPAVVPTR